MDKRLNAVCKTQMSQQCSCSTFTEDEVMFPFADDYIKLNSVIIKYTASDLLNLNA